MANPYYNHGSVPPQGAFGGSPPMRGEFDLIAAGFALLPSLSGNANKIVRVNAGATALEAVSGLSGVSFTDQTFFSPGTDAAPGISFTGDTGVGFYAGGSGSNTAKIKAPAKLSLIRDSAGNGYIEFTYAVSPFGANAGVVVFLDGTGGINTRVGTEAAHILSQINGTNAQEFRVYGTTTGPKYASLKHDGTNAILTANSGVVQVPVQIDISGASAGQIKFPSTQNASANANTLDDYSEGTFTPALNFGGSVTGITYGTQLGHFTKIGNTVKFTINLVLTSKGAQTGAATITGMPFTSTNTAGYRAAFSLYFTAGATLTTNMLMVTIPANSTTLSLFDLAAAAASALDNTDFTNTSEVTITGSYRV